MAGNNPAVLRLKTYIDANDVPEAQLRAATDAQWLAVMYPDSPGNAPYHETPGDAPNHMTVGIAQAYLKGWYRERTAPAIKARIMSFLAANGYAMESAERGEGDSWVVTISPVDE